VRADFSLELERAGTDYRVTWDGHSPVVQAAKRGVLLIKDGGFEKELELDREQLATDQQALKMKTDSVQGSIKEWEVKVVDANARIAQAERLKLNVSRTSVGSAEKWCVDIPISVYLGWISVATIANISDWLYFVHWDGFGIAPPAWAVIMLTVASLLGLWMALTRRDSGYLFVFVWAFAGIAIKQAAAPLVTYSAWVAALIALGLAIYTIFQRRRMPA